jgi:hypothetical protein
MLGRQSDLAGRISDGERQILVLARRPPAAVMVEITLATAQLLTVPPQA